MAENRTNIETKEISVKDIRSKFEAKVKDKGNNEDIRARTSSLRMPVKDEGEKANKGNPGAEGISSERSSVSSIIKQFQKKIDSTANVKIPQPTTANVSEKKIDTIKADKPFTSNVVDQKLGRVDKAKQQNVDDEDEGRIQAEISEIHDDQGPNQRDEEDESTNVGKDNSSHLIEEKDREETGQESHQERESPKKQQRNSPKKLEGEEIGNKHEEEEGLKGRKSAKPGEELTLKEQEVDLDHKEPDQTRVKTDEEEIEESSALKKTKSESEDQKMITEHEKIDLGIQETHESLKLKKGLSDSLGKHSPPLKPKHFLSHGLEKHPFISYDDSGQRKSSSPTQEDAKKHSEIPQVQANKEAFAVLQDEQNHGNNSGGEEDEYNRENTPLTGSQVTDTRNDKPVQAERVKSNPLSPSFASVDLGDLGTIRLPQATEEDHPCSNTLNLEDLCHVNIEEEKAQTTESVGCCQRSLEMIKSVQNCLLRLIFKPKKKTYSEFGNA